jgi:hypothetical protein
MRPFLIILLTLVLSAHLGAQRVFYDSSVENWTSLDPPPRLELMHSVILVGDIKYPASDSTMMSLLAHKLEQAGDQNGSLIILGDLAYPRGLPEEDEKGFSEAERDLAALLSTIRSFEGDILMVPGNHDWDKGGKDGWDHVKNESAFISKWLDRDNVYLLEGGCPGPVEVPLTKDITAILFDSQWWFQKFEKPGPDEGCDFEDEAGLFTQVEDIIRRNKGKKIIFATHHPLFSVGNHGGYFHPSRLFFPLLDVHKALYVPLPGFIYTLYRKYLGSIQDLAHPEYKILKNTFLEVFREYPDIIYAAGHEHNLQYLDHNSLHHIVSGGGGEGTYIRKKAKKTNFAMAGAGLSILNFYASGDVWVEFWTPGDGNDGELVFRHKLFNREVYDPEKEYKYLSSLNFSDSVVQVRLSDIYNKGRFVRFWMGDNYREVWEQPVILPVFDIGREKGGLEILKRGGGQQTRSVRLADRKGKEYVLRSVNKYVEKAIDPELRNTLAQDAVQDAISASHPFAAVTVPELADAAGVMHTNPRIVWVPDDPRLGIYRKDLANGVFLFEERPAGERIDVASFGSSEMIVSTDKTIKKTQDKHTHKVDQEAVVRARIFDLFLNDWDRHDDQWRWSVSEKGEEHLYRPIPRDRDQVYFVNEGVVMWLAQQDFIQPKFQGFDHRIKNVRGLGYNARYFDRSFMTEPDHEMWLKIAGSIQKNLTDAVITNAISAMPDEIYALSGREIEDKLKSRRNDLDQYADGLYRFLAREVDVVGTDERELFWVKRFGNGFTEVTVFALSDKKGRIKEQLYQREFNPTETKEIRLYGLKGQDKFVVDGIGGSAIKVRVVPGKDNDTVLDYSNIWGRGKTLVVYERKNKKNFIKKGKETRLKLSNDKTVDDYDRKQYKYDKTVPLLAAGFNIDDGFYLGGGVHWKRYNFRDSTLHRIDGTVAFATGAFSLNYQGLYSAFSQYFDLLLDASVSMPRNVDNFYGLGNETKNESNDKSYYRVRYEYAILNPQLKHQVNKAVNYKFGAFYQYFSVNDTAGRFIGDTEQNMLDSVAFDRHHFVGINAGLEIDTRDNEVLPRRGMLWSTTASAFYGLDRDAKNYIKLQSDLRFYLSFTADPRVVFAFRFGGAVNVGDYEFYQANFLGGRTNLRGFRSNRFAGDQTFYQNTEIRVKLLNLKSYIFNGQTGFYVFNDLGRVWFDGELSRRWHDGYGLGVWLTPFEFTALTLSYNLSDDDKMFVFNLKFLF